jgi:hypothetical protein
VSMVDFLRTHNKHAVALTPILSNPSYTRLQMVLESLAAAGLVGNIIQFIDFSSKILSKTQQVYQSGLLAENIDIELVTNHLIKLSKELQTSANSSNSDPTLEKLCESCNDVANELLEALGELKVNGRNGIWRSVRKALKSVLSKEKIESIQMRLTGFRDELSLHIVVGIRYYNISCADCLVRQY